MKTQEPRRGSGINTDQFPKRAPKAQASRVVRDMLPLEIFLGFWVILTGCWPVLFSSDEALQIFIIIIKNISVMTDLTDFRKTVETGAVPRLGAVGELPRSINSKKRKISHREGKKVSSEWRLFSKMNFVTCRSTYHFSFFEIESRINKNSDKLRNCIERAYVVVT